MGGSFRTKIDGKAYTHQEISSMILRKLKKDAEDYTQHTLVIDRQTPKLDDIYDAHYLAILRMLQMVVDNGQTGSISAVCRALITTIGIDKW